LQRLCDALNFAPVFCVFGFLNAASILQCTDFFASERRKITTWFSDMIPNLANTLQLQMLASHCCKILSDGKAPSNELMLRHTRQCTGASCKILQILRDFEILTATNDQNIVHRCFHTGASTKTCFYTGICTYTCVYPEMVLHTNTFTQVFYTGVLLHKKLLHTNARILLNTDAFTLRSCWGMLLHARAFTQGFFWHKVAFTHRSFYSKYILLCRDALTQKYTFVQTCFLTHRYFIKRYFYTRI
jgi:hypothetical protein